MLVTRQATRGGKFVAARPEPVFGDALHLTETSTVQPGGVGTLTGLPLRPPAGAGRFVMSAIKFQIQPATVGNLAGTLNVGSYLAGQGFDLGAVVSVTFSLVRYSGPVESAGPIGAAPAASFGCFSNRVPITALCDSRDVSAALMSGGSSAGSGVPYTAIHPISEYRWDLAVPFEVPSGYILVPQFYNLGQNVGPSGGTLATIPALQVQVSYEGTLIARDGDEGYDYDDGLPADVINVPFACAWAPPSQTLAPTSPAFAQTADETSLINIFDTPAVIAQFNGKIITLPELTDITGDADEALQVRMVTGGHRPIVRDFASFRTVFARETRAWNTMPGYGAPFALAPGEYIAAALGGITSFYVGGLSTTIQPMIGVTGYRPISRTLFAEGP